MNNVLEARKNPVVIEAIKWTGYNKLQIVNFIKTEFRYSDRIPGKSQSIFILTLEGEMEARLGDYIIKGVNGEFYPCKPDIFKKTYEILPYQDK